MTTRSGSAAGEACRGCGVTVRLAPGEAERMLAEYLRLHPQPLADDTVSGERLARCLRCDALEYGTTCRHCGCVVAVRARLLAERCPHPAGARW